MNSENNPIVILDANEQIPHHVHREESTNQSLIQVGQWYWVKEEADKDQERDRWLGCVMHIGSNYVALEHPSKPSYSTMRIRLHIDDCLERLEREYDPQSYINAQISYFQNLVNDQINEVKEITARLGITTQEQLSNHATSEQPTSNTLVVVASQENVNNYKDALVHAKDTLLPELFNAIKESNAELTKWMMANTLPLNAARASLTGSIDNIKERIFHVSLYAGLTESVISCCSGEPGAYHEKLHIMQRMHYMDEECLLNYRHGGMDFDNIGQFDAWISEPQNRDRILPFSKTLVAMRVRRHVKDRPWDGSINSLFINFNMAISDKFTYLYIRNGEQVSRLVCDIDFGESIFPDRDVFDPQRPIMVKMFNAKVDEVMSVDEYEQNVQEFNQLEANYKQWQSDNPKEQWESTYPGMSWNFANPYRHLQFRKFNPTQWKLFDQDNLYFDEIAEYFTNKLKEYNRIALIIQGLFDRSPVLHPHPPARIWSPRGFAAAIDLIYDASQALHFGEAPDIEAYINRCNASLDVGSMTVGQELYWMEKEAEKECRRIENDFRSRSEYRPKVFKPEGNPGPGFLAKITKWKPRARIATYEWRRLRRAANPWDDDPNNMTVQVIHVPENRIFNVDAYRPGDYLQFFRDSRTRAQYLKWAPMLLAAEEYHAGNFDFVNKFDRYF